MQNDVPQPGPKNKYPLNPGPNWRVLLVALETSQKETPTPVAMAPDISGHRKFLFRPKSL